MSPLLLASRGRLFAACNVFLRARLCLSSYAQHHQPSAWFGAALQGRPVLPKGPCIPYSYFTAIFIAPSPSSTAFNHMRRENISSILVTAHETANPHAQDLQLEVAQCMAFHHAAYDRTPLAVVPALRFGLCIALESYFHQPSSLQRA